MEKVIARLENRLRNPKTPIIKRFFIGSCLLVCYFLMSLKYFWYLFFSEPTKSFALANSQDENGVWQRSYYQHRKFRHNLRFGSISFTLLLVTTILGINFIISLIIPFKQVTITYADTFTVTNTNNNGAGSLRKALVLAALNPGADTISVTVSGTSNVLSNLNVVDDITIDAAGVDFIISGDVVLELAGNNITITNLQFINAGIRTSNAHNNISLNDLTMTGSDVNHAVHFNSGDNNSFNNLTISNYADGIFLQNSNAITISGGEISGCDHEGIFVDNSQDVTITNISSHDNGWHGVKIDQDSTDITVQQSQIYSNTMHGIYIAGNEVAHGGQGSLFTSNDIYSNAQNGILVQNMEDIDIIGNNIYNNSASGVFLTDADDISITDNDIYGNTDEGIRVDSATDNTISTNTISNNNYGVSILPGSDATGITDNEIYSNAAKGVLLYSDNNNVENNYIGTNASLADLGNGEDGILISDGGANNAINSNHIQFNDQNGIALIAASTNNIFASNEIKHNNLNGISIRASSNSNTIGPANTITNNVNYGIEVSDSKYNKITQNIINSNSNGNIYLNTGNENLAAPVILTAVASTNKLIATGTAAENNGRVEVFGSDAENGANGYLIDGEFDNGTFSIEKTEDITDTHDYLTATFTDSDNNTSEFSSLVITVDTTAPTSSASPAGGTYDSAQTITLSATDDRDTIPKIFFTTDGSTPTVDDTLLYSEAFTINENTTLKFFAKDDVNNSEAVHTEEYIISSEEEEETEEEFLTDRENWKINNQELSNTNLPRLTDQTPTFLLKNAPDEYIGRKVRIVIKQRQQTILIMKKEINARGRAKFIVEENLDIGAYTLKVSFNNGDTNWKVTDFEIIDPTPDLRYISDIIVPQDIMVASSAEKVILFLRDAATNAEIVHAISSDSETGIHALSFPYWPKPGEYILEAVAESNGVQSEVVSKNIILTPNIYVKVLNAVPTDKAYWHRLTDTANPTVAGLTSAGQKVFVNGVEATISQPCTDVCSWSIRLAGTSVGVNTITISYQDENGQTLNTTSYKFLRHLSAITPRIVSHPNGYSSNKPLLLTIIGHSGDEVYVYKNGEVIKTCILESGLCKVSTASFADYGDNTIKLRALENGYKWSNYSTFTFTLRRPVTTIIPPPAEEQPAEEQPTEEIIEQPVINEEEEEQIIDVVEELIDKEYNETKEPKPPKRIVPITKEKEKLTTEQKQELTQELTQLLRENKTISIYVGNQSVIPQTQTDGSLLFNIVTEYDLASFIKRILGWQKASMQAAELKVEGGIPVSQIKNLPAFAILTIYSQPIVKVAKADESGRWTITVPVELLPAGQHTAYLQTEVNGVQSEQVELVKFAVEEKVKLSKTAWLVIINVSIVLLLLIMLIIKQSFKNKKLAAKQ